MGEAAGNGQRPALARVRPLVLGLAALALTSAHGSSAQGQDPTARPELHFHGRDVSAGHWDGGFTLTDMEQRPRTLADFRGKIVLLAFGYTRCPDVCPTTLAKFAQVRRLLGAAAQNVQGLFVSLDPQNDSAALLQQYVRGFDPSFIGLRGSPAQTAAVVRAFHARYRVEAEQGTSLVAHTASTYIIDAQGRPRVVSPYDQSAQTLADDVLALLRSS